MTKATNNRETWICIAYIKNCGNIGIRQQYFYILSMGGLAFPRWQMRPAIASGIQACHILLKAIEMLRVNSVDFSRYKYTLFPKIPCFFYCLWKLMKKSDNHSLKSLIKHKLNLTGSVQYTANLALRWTQDVHKGAKSHTCEHTSSLICNINIHI